METAVDDIVIPVEPVFYEAPAEVAPRRVAAPPAEAAAPPPASAALPRSDGRRLRPWPIIAAVGAALVAGLVIGRISSSSPGSGSSTAIGAANQSAVGAANGGAAQPAAGARQARTPVSNSPTTAYAPAASAVNGHPVVLNIPRQTGPLITQHFTVTGSKWTLGWAYDCTGTPSGTGAFNVKVMNANGDASNDGGVDQNGAKGSSVVAYISTGERYLWVTTDCVWAVRVTT